MTSTIALHTPVPLSLTFSEEKGNTPSLTQAPAYIKCLMSCTLKSKLCCVNYTRTMTQCITLTCVKFKYQLLTMCCGGYKISYRCKSEAKFMDCFTKSQPLSAQWPFAYAGNKLHLHKKENNY